MTTAFLHKDKSILRSLAPPWALRQEPAISLNYRPDIDGLRALAVSIVIGYHAFPSLLPGGFVGVDIFFVISGYLITLIIFQEMISTEFTIRRFYARRIRRIFPALLVVIPITFALGWFTLPPKDFKSLGENIAGAAAFIQNIVLLGQVGYFDIAANTKPLLHLWSLGIEEQYYIAWPIVLLIIRKWELNPITATLFMAIGSFLFGFAVLTRSVDLAFYLPFTRAWELLVGSVLALRMYQAKDLWPAGSMGPWLEQAKQSLAPGLQMLRGRLPIIDYGKLAEEVVAIGAIVAIIWAVRKLNSQSPYPGYYALIPVVAAAILIASRDAWINRMLLSKPWMVFIGLISYPLYLWHFPLMAYARIIWFEAVPRPVMGGVIVLSIVLAWLVYRLVEKPVRFGSARQFINLGLLAGMGGVGLVGLAAYGTEGFPRRLPEAVRGFMLTGEETSIHWRRGSCLLLPNQGAEDFSAECGGDGRRPLLLLWGDSYAAALYPGLNTLAAGGGFGVAEFTASACPPLINFVHLERRYCKTINDFVLKQISSLLPEVVILHSTWSYGDHDLDQGLEQTVSQLKALNIKQIVLLGPVPAWKGGGLSKNVLDYYLRTFAVLPPRTKIGLNDKWNPSIDKFLEAKAKQLEIEYISPLRIMCDESGCLARIGDDGSELTAFDPGHLTVPGSIFLSRAILPALLYGVPGRQ
jgi:peptidoglycan/LPS O-acetylase OafA/YrhL